MLFPVVVGFWLPLWLLVVGTVMAGAGVGVCGVGSAKTGVVKERELAAKMIPTSGKINALFSFSSIFIISSQLAMRLLYHT